MISVAKLGMTVRQTVAEHRPRIGVVGKQLLEERELSEQRGQNHQAAVAVLNISGCDQRVEQEAQRIDENVTLFAFDQLAPIKPVGIDARPPFPRFSRSDCLRCRRWDWPRVRPALGI